MDYPIFDETIDLSQRKTKRKRKSEQHQPMLEEIPEDLPLILYSKKEKPPVDEPEKYLVSASKILKPILEVLYLLLCSIFTFSYNQCRNIYFGIIGKDGFSYDERKTLSFNAKEFARNHGRTTLIFIFVLVITCVVYVNRYSIKKLIDVDVYRDSQGRTIIDPFLFFEDVSKESWTYIGDVEDDEFVKWHAIAKKKSFGGISTRDLSNGFVFTNIMGLQEKRNVSFELLENSMRTLSKESNHKKTCWSSLNFGLPFVSIFISGEASPELMIEPKITKKNSIKKQRVRAVFPDSFDSMEEYIRRQEYRENRIDGVNDLRYESIFPSEVFVEWFSLKSNEVGSFEKSGYFTMEDAACVCFVTKSDLCK